MSSIADRQRHDSKINRCRDQSCQAKNQQCHPNDREIMQPVAHGEVSQLSLHGLREFDLDQNALSTTLHGCPLWVKSRHPSRHSITSSAVASRVGATVRPSVLAVLRLMTNSNLLGCWTARSAVFSPLRMRST